MLFQHFGGGMGTKRLKTTAIWKAIISAILIQDLMSWAFWSLFIAAQIWCNQSSPWKVIKKRQATNAQGWIVLLKEASLCSADNQMNGCADRSPRGTHCSPIPYPGLGSVFLLIGAHNPISANGSYAPALLETIDPLRGTIVPSNQGGKQDCLFPAAIQEGQAEPPELFLCETAEQEGFGLPSPSVAGLPHLQ